jgi:hypothetical protein
MQRQIKVIHKGKSAPRRVPVTLIGKPAKQNWFETLNASLASEGLVDLWPSGMNIGYGETARVTVDDGSKHGRLISIYRDETGRYERPVHYQR